jgi:hypothetical protein
MENGVLESEHGFKHLLLLIFPLPHDAVGRGKMRRRAGKDESAPGMTKKEKTALI